MRALLSGRQEGLHTPFVKHKLQQRLRHFSRANIQQLDQARTPGGLPEGAMPEWFEALTEVQRQIVRDTQQRSRTSSQNLAKTLKGLKGVVEFAQPLLEDALLEKFGIKVDTANTWLYTELYRDRLITDQNPLQLALRNFADEQPFAETDIIAEQGERAPIVDENDGPYGWYYPKFGHSQCYRIKKLAIKPGQFALLCRELDIGKQYQQHLAAIFDAADTAATVKAQTIEAWKESLRAHAHIARLTSLLSPTAYLAVLGVLNEEPATTLDGEPVVFSQLHVLGLPASEMFVLGANRRKQKKIDLSLSNPGTNLFSVLGYTDSRIIVCIPGDPVAPIKEYASLRAFERDLALRLRDAAYQRSFLRLIPHGDAGRFLGSVQSALQTLKWDPDAPHREQTLFGHFDGIYQRVYRDDPVLDLAENFFAENVFDELYTRHQTRLKESSAQLAVPTATVDHDAWYARLAHYAEWGLNILNVAAFFIPGLGEVMMAVMALQLTLDVYHGAQAWSIGDSDQAWSYLSAVAANLAFMAVLGAAASRAPKILSTPFVDGMVKVKLPFGDEQLWRPGVAPYRSPVVLPSTLEPNSFGQYAVGSRTFIRLEGEVYEQTFDSALGRWRLKHPSDPNAYQPALRSNGQGAWRHDFERPLQWDRATLLRRLGHATDGLDTAALENIARISGVDDSVLRKMHIDHQAMPSVLSDTLRQFRNGVPVETALTPEIKQLQGTFPSLSNDAAQEVLSAATVQERRLIERSGRLPVSLLLKARTRARVGRMNRALAGMQQPGLASFDSQRLALRALEKQPGWPQSLRLEVRQHDCTGKILASIGNDSAEDVKYLVTEGGQHHQTGQFQAFDSQGNALNSVPQQGDNFHQSLMHALPDDARIRLGLPNVGQSAELQSLLSQYAQRHRNQMFETLFPNAPGRRFKSPTRLVDGRIGYPLSGRGASTMVNLSLTSRVRDLYPDFSDESAEMMIHHLLLGGSTETQIVHLLNLRAMEYATLAIQLEQWSAEGGASLARQQTAQMVKDAWRLRGLVDVPAGIHLDWGNAGVLPELTAHFPHVSSVQLSVDSLLSQSSESLMRQFPNIRSLELYVWDPLQSARLAEKLKMLPGIRELLLGGNLGSEFSEAAQSLVNVMPQLESLTLRGISSALDVSQLPRLRALNVAGTLERWPKGILELPGLEQVNLRHANIKALPAELYAGHEKLWRGLDLNWARLDAEQFVKAYEYVRDNPAHVLDSEQILERYSRDSLQIAMDCGSDLSAAALRQIKARGLSGRALLDHINALRQDLQMLSGQLTDWQERLAIVNGRTVDLNARRNAARLIRECWREGLRQRFGLAGDASVNAEPRPGSSTSLPLPVVAPYNVLILDLSGAALGDLPDLSALATTDFSHVLALKLSEVVAPVDALNQFLPHFSELRTLDLSRNQLFDLPSTLKQLPKLKDLGLQHNYLTITPSLQGRLNGLSGLETLDLRYNRVESLNVTTLRGLKRLRLGHTALAAWPEGVLELPALTRLELNNSAVVNVPEAVFSGHDQLQVDLGGCRLTTKARHDLLAKSHEFAPMGISRTDLREGFTLGGPAYFPPLVSQFPELLLPLRVESAEQLVRMTAKARLQRLDPDLRDSEALQAVDDLSLSHGAGALFARMDHWDMQFQTLTESLNQWITQPPFQLREMSLPLWVSAVERRKAADQILACWRQNLRGLPAAERGSAGFTLDLSENPLGDLPTLAGNFSHVGILKLNKVFISEQGLDGFLGAFQGIHTLELNSNLLANLPAPVFAINDLKHLSASGNQLRSTPQLTTQLATLTQLQSLDLSHNWLESLDVSPLAQLGALNLQTNRLVAWPEGVLELPSLTTLNLRDNMLEAVPHALMSERYSRLRAGVDLSSNDSLSGQSLIMLRNEINPGETIMGWSAEELDEVLDSEEADSIFGSDTSPLSDEEVDVGHVTGDEARQRWIDPASNDAQELTRIWRDFEQQPDSAAFFNLLDRMEGTKDFALRRTDLTRRVHRVLKAADSDESLRRTVFAMAQSAQTCGDGRILLFSDIEVKVFEFDTVKSTPLNQQDSVLFKLGRKLFRLGRIEKIADRDVLQRQARGGRPDPAEVRLAYRIGLGDRLDLPGQPKDMLYSGNVSAGTLDTAYAEVIAAEQSADFVEDLVTRDYWIAQLKRKYPGRFAVLKDKQAQIQGELEDRYTEITEAYLAEVGALEVEFKTQETGLLLELTNTERQQFSV